MVCRLGVCHFRSNLLKLFCRRAVFEPYSCSNRRSGTNCGMKAAKVALIDNQLGVPKPALCSTRHHKVPAFGGRTEA